MTSITRDALVEFMRGPSPITHEPLATKVAEEWADKFIEQFGVREWGWESRFTHDGSDPAKKNGKAGDLYDAMWGLPEREAREVAQWLQAEEDKSHPPHLAELHCTYSAVSRVKIEGVVA